MVRRLFLTLMCAGLVGACEDYNDRDDSGVTGERCVKTSCTAEGIFCDTIPDGCGGFIHCGRCEAPFTCGGGDNDDIIECGCTPRCDGRCGGPDGCGSLCTDTCAAPETCGGGGVQDLCGCLPDCVGKCSGDDSCGGTCTGACTSPNTCGGGIEPNECGCTPQCTGLCLAPDGCGGQCADTCSNPQTCGGGGIPNVCGCTPNCVGRCGGDDGCGGLCPDLCSGFDTCGGDSAQPNQCGCEQRSCNDYLTDAGFECGTFPDCTGYLDCTSACGGAEVCDERDGSCCTPDCSGRTCGADGCGGSCGTCTWPEVCGGDGTVNVCTVPPDSCSFDDWCFQYPQPIGLDLNAVWAADISELWAVGDHGAMLKRSPSGWQREEIGVDANLHGIFGTAINSARAVGDGGTIVRFNGVTWNPEESGLTADLFDVWEDSNGEAFAVGEGGRIREYNGTLWTGVVSPVTDDLHAVWGFSGEGVWAVGERGTIVRTTNFVIWDEIASPTNFDLTDIWGSAADDLWITGQGDDPGEAVLLHWDGNSLQPVSLSLRANELRLEEVDGFTSVFGTATDNVWLASVSADGGGAIWHWDGSSWLGDNGPDRAWRAVFPIASRVIGVGDRGSVATRDNDAWTLHSQTLPALDAGVLDIHGSSSTDVWAIAVSREAWRYDGTTWTTDVLPDVKPNRVYSFGANDVWMVGATLTGLGQSISYRDVSGWTTLVDDPVGQTLNDVWVNNASDVWVVGNNGTVLRGDVNGFSAPAVAPAGPFNYRGIAGFDQDTIWIVGGGVLLQWNGVSWFQRVNTLSTLFQDIWAANDNDVWVVGTQGIVYRSTDGSSFFPESNLPSIGGAVTFSGVYGTSSTDVWVVGTADDGTQIVPVTVHWNGAAWSLEDAGALGALVGVFADGNEAWTAAIEGVYRKGP